MLAIMRGEKTVSQVAQANGVKPDTVQNYLDGLISGRQRDYLKSLGDGISPNEWPSRKEASRRIDAAKARHQKEESEERAKSQRCVKDWKYEPPSK